MLAKSRFLVCIFMVISTPFALSNTLSKIPVETEVVKFETSSVEVKVSGKLYKKQLAHLSFAVAGKVEKIYVDEGVSVAKGELLASLDQTEVVAQYNKALNTFDKFMIDFINAEKLLPKQQISQDTYNNAKLNLELSKSNLKQSEYLLKQAQIFAPSDGQVLKRHIEEQQQVSPSLIAFTISNQASGIIFKAYVSDKQIIKLSLNDELTLILDAYPNQTLLANISEIGLQSDPLSGLYEIEARVQPSSQKLFSGMIGNAKIKTLHSQALAALSLNALVKAKNKSGEIYVVENGKASLRKIQIARIEHGKMYVFEGVTNGEEVITNGSKNVYQGSELHINRINFQ